VRGKSGSGSVTRQKLIERQRSGRCLTCGSSNHKTESCRRRNSPRRTPTPKSRFHHRKHSSSSRQKVNFKVSTMEGTSQHRPGSEYVTSKGKTPASGREGDVQDDAENAVDAYLAVRSIGRCFPSQRPIADYFSQSDFE
jgi:hypothetical protein